MTLDNTYDKEEQANVVTKIFGGDENVNLRSSAVPWKFDEWFHGDFTKQWQDDLGSTLSSKFLEEYNDYFPNYRINSVVEIGLDTNGDSVTDYEVKMTDPESTDPDNPGGMAPITLEGASDEPDNIFRNDLDHYDDGKGQKLPADVKGPYTNKEKITVNGVDGVRASIILGGSDPYLQKLKQDFFTLTDIVDEPVPFSSSRFMLHVATFYSFIDFAFMADGAIVVRVWDASVYPAQALYVGGERMDKNEFREGIEWVEQGNTFEHDAFNKFGTDAQNPYATPFDQGGHFLYDFHEGFGDHPVMEFIAQSSTIDGTEGEFVFPLTPNYPLI